MDHVLNKGGAPVQHREVQEKESNLFEDYFEKGIKYLPGGVQSGFANVTTEKDKRLFIVYGDRKVKIKQIGLRFSNLNKSDCFILDCGKGDVVMVYMPEGSSRMEKFRATQAANEIRDDDHKGNAKLEIIDTFSGNSAKFFEALGDGGSSDQIPDHSKDLYTPPVNSGATPIFK